MSEYAPISSKAELAFVDESDCMAGYLSGLENSPHPGSDKSKSFWHGWRNGMMDKGNLRPDAASENLAREVVRSWRAN